MRRIQDQGAAARGFTLIELMLSTALLAILAAKVSMAISAANEANADSTRRIVLEDQARRVLNQIAVSVMGANRATLLPETEAPLSISDMRFQMNLGVRNGVVIWSDPEQVALEEGGRQVFWTRNPDAATQQRIIWSKLAAPFLEGEIPNGMDDNGNGLIDEKGLSFEVDRNAVCIRLTLERIADDGTVVTETVETTVTCRNLVIGP